MHKKRIPKKIKKIIIEYINALKEDDINIEEVYLYGSYAKGKQKKWSDIDICIISGDFKDAFSALQYLWSKRVKDTGITIEPIGFSKKDFRRKSPLTEEIKNKGIKILH